MVDDLAGTTHQVYGGLPDPVYLIDVTGRVAFYNMWAHAPTLHEALKEMVRQRGRGVVLNGVDRRIHPLAALTDGWLGIRHGLLQSVIDLETALPTSGALLWLGYQMKPLLAPLTLRAHPLPREARIGLALGAGLLAAGLIVAATRRRGTRVPEPALIA